MDQLTPTVRWEKIRATATSREIHPRVLHKILSHVSTTMGRGLRYQKHQERNIDTFMFIYIHH